ncbi:MAG: hypothetical protein ACYTDY_02660 [Planctomycetota bacterium]|jgi:tetratricopeptide (TPR) repeat protein
MPDVDEANRHFELGDECSTSGAMALQTGNTDEGLDWFRQAIDAYEAALRAAPEEETLLVCNLKLCIGARQFGLGSVDEALARYEEALAALAGRADLTSEGEGLEILAQARLNRAECRLAKGQPGEALTEVDEVLALIPDHPFAKHLRERCELEAG